MTMDYFRFLQLLLAALGLIFSVASYHIYWLLVVVYAIILTYESSIVICLLAGKAQLGSSIQAFIEIALGILLIIYTTYLLAAGEKDVLIIMTIVIGYVLPPLLFITAYDKFRHQ